MESARVRVVRAAYDCFNSKDASGVLEFCDSDIEIPDPIHESVRRGKADVEQYWQHEFGLVDHVVSLGEIVEMGDQVVAVARHQMYNPDGSTLAEPVRAVHRFTFKGDKIAKMEYSGLDDVPDSVRERFDELR